METPCSLGEFLKCPCSGGFLPEFHHVFQNWLPKNLWSWPPRTVAGWKTQGNASKGGGCPWMRNMVDTLLGGSWTLVADSTSHPRGPPLSSWALLPCWSDSCWQHKSAQCCFFNNALDSCLLPSLTDLSSRKWDHNSDSCNKECDLAQEPFQRLVCHTQSPPRLLRR
jgi:hypothetical protein